MFTWYHALIIFLIANAVSVIPAGVRGDFDFYNSFARPRVAPPDWLFAPMWLCLNVASLVGLAIVFNSDPSNGRTAFIWLEGVGWVLFALFNTVYFSMKSPTLGAVDTTMGLAVGIASAAVAVAVSPLAAFLVSLRVAWLGLATYVSVWVARRNPDPFFEKHGRRSKG